MKNNNVIITYRVNKAANPDVVLPSFLSLQSKSPANTKEQKLLNEKYKAGNQYE